MSELAVSPSVRSKREAKLIDKWQSRRESAEKDRRRYESAWLTSQQFAAGRQWAAYLPREHRMVVPPLPSGRSRHTADRITQYIMTVVGQLAGDDFRGRFTPAHDDQEGIEYDDTLNDLLAYGWEREWKGDARCLKLCRTLAWLGTGGIRVRFDNDKGQQLADVPHRDGKPILDPEEARKFVAEASYYGEPTGMKSIREGGIVWDSLTPWNLLPPPGVEEPDDFPWDMIVRPVHVGTIERMYNVELEPESIQSMDVLGMEKGGYPDETMPATGSPGVNIDEHALVYTGYERACAEYPKGQTVVFTKERQLDRKDGLPLPETSCQPARSGITYFHYWRIPNRFWGRALAEPGFGPQRIINKRLTQMDEVIDRALPKVFVDRGSILSIPDGRVMEVIEMKPGASKPQIDPGIGPAKWFADDIAQQDQNIEKALGVRGVSLGENPSGVQTYGQLALLRESDADKIDPIAAQLRLSITECTYDSIELMRQWPPTKKVMIVGEDDTLSLRTFESFKLPADYMVIPTKGGTQLRTTAAELQKIKDIWDAASQSGRAQDPRMLDWYVTSLNAGKAQDIPSDPAVDQQHIAALENILLARGEELPVSPDQNHQVHIGEHEDEKAEWETLAAMGDPDGQRVLMNFDRHIQLHQSFLAPVGAPAAQPPQAPVGPGGVPAPPLAPVQ